MVDLNVITEKLKQLSLRIAKVRALCRARVSYSLHRSAERDLTDAFRFYKADGV